ncbi:MAG: gliding motility-associated C-terminal domain-containing protein [Bacteroidetes bacterium]|nr:gliding motility-associated C-terminal domain-containing protein [Bacteroidota bacterium]MBU1717918.1 gliding motility-associated C-terminal domain-containing protein [Bacteroidota bacterium]
MLKRLFWISLLLLLVSNSLFATHNRAGEITYRCTGGLTYEIKIVTYTFSPSLADRPQLSVDYGDGVLDTIYRTEEIEYPNDIKRNVYIGVHVYPGAGIYTISLEDPNRNEGIFNIPNSVNVPFYISTELIINPFLGINNSPELLNPPLDNACVGQLFIHNPGAYDSDGDSISYELIKCKGENGLDIPGYSFPPANNSITINALTGDLIWDTPVMQGEYNVAILIKEWRNGVKIGEIIRDMQILVTPCNNHAPIIDEIADTCVNAGDLLEFLVHATDQDGDSLTLVATGGPLQLTSSPAIFSQPVIGMGGDVDNMFSWQTECSHIRKEPYSIVFKVTDDGGPTNESIDLVDIETVSIRVVGPAPDSLKTEPIGNSIHLSWFKSECSNALGYYVYRRSGFYGFIPDHCEIGVPSFTGYQKIATLENIDDTTYMDDNNGLGLIRGVEYCYIVTAFFHNVEGYASEESCTELIKDVPVLTHVSIRNTDVYAGSVYVVWSKPTDIDSSQIPGPHLYKIFRSQGLTGASFQLVDSLVGLNDTIFIDTLVNTAGNAVSYRIDLYNSDPANYFYVGASQIASSPFLSVGPFDNRLVLSWQTNVQWTNYQYEVFRKNPGTGLFDSLTTTISTTYTDTGLTNGIEYCYRILTIGDYPGGDFISPILNYSQIECQSPVDTEAPCAPDLSLRVDCDMSTNQIFWTNPNNSCADDVVSYKLFYSPTESGSFSMIANLFSSTDTVFFHEAMESIAGCYYVTAIDSFANESQPSVSVCLDIDSCNLFMLPNVFTPNGDGYNDFFGPGPYKFIESIDISIFNRWGMKVYSTTNPAIDWDGKNQRTKGQCPDGVYYYICDVYEIRLKGIVKRTLTGLIHIIANDVPFK